MLLVNTSQVLKAEDATTESMLDCLIEPHTVAHLSSEVPGIIDKILVQRGEHVKKGQRLFSLKSTVERSAVELAQAKSDFSKRKITRNDDLFQKQLISTHELDEMETESKIAELELKDARTRLRLRTIRSPIDGVVVVRHYSTGEYVSTEPVIEIAKINPLKVEVIAQINWIGKIKSGDKAEIFPVAPIGGKYLGKVTIVDGIVDAASGTFGVRVNLPNKAFDIPAGINCEVRFSQ